MGFFSNIGVLTGYHEACADIVRRYEKWQTLPNMISEPYPFMCEVFSETCRSNGLDGLALATEEIVKPFGCLPHPQGIKMMFTLMGVNLGAPDWKNPTILKLLKDGTADVYHLVSILNSDELNARFARNNPKTFVHIVTSTGKSPFDPSGMKEFSGRIQNVVKI